MITFKQDLEKVDKCLAPLTGGEKDTTIAHAVHFELGLKTQASLEFIRVALANALLMDRKQDDYGSKNVAEFGAYGCVVKMSDKMERLKHLFATGRKKKVQNESIVDSFRDQSNYGIIALIIDQGRWPNE